MGRSQEFFTFENIYISKLLIMFKFENKTNQNKKNVLK